MLIIAFIPILSKEEEKRRNTIYEKYVGAKKSVDYFISPNQPGFLQLPNKSLFLKYWGQMVTKKYFFEITFFHYPPFACVCLTSRDIACWHSREQNVLVIGSSEVIANSVSSSGHIDTVQQCVNRRCLSHVILPLTRKVQGLDLERKQLI